ncbi:MAG TPA: DUF5689 domain-containing protein, partial [Chitinophagaceae bacterium]|nr:DUF5689 domain-containing protein [Chitinophagaceae bacterium]
MNQNKLVFKKRIAAFFFTALTFIACSKDDIIPPTTNPPQSVPKVEFSVESEALLESDFQLVQLNFNRKTSKAEKLVVSLASTNLEYGTHYVTEPAAVNGKVTLDISAGAENAFIKVIPVNNDSKDDVRELRFTIATEGTTLQPYGKKDSKLVFIDDDSKFQLAFAAEAAAIAENNPDGYEISINITPQSEVNGHIELTFLSNDQYGTSWSSLPAAQNNRIRIPVQQGADKVSFRIKPVNDFLFNSDRTIRFNVSSASTNFILPVKNEFNLSINNDDVEYGPLSIANIRRSFNGQEMYFVYDALISGTIISTNQNLDPKMIYIQDQTGGIALKLTADYQPQFVGNKLNINLEGGVIKEVNGNLEIHGVSNANISPIGFDIVPVEEMTLQQLYAHSSD